VHVWKKLQSIINPPKHNISKNNGRILFPSRWKKMKSTPTLKKWPFFKVRKKALVVVRSSKFKLNKKISLKIYNFYLYDIFRGPFLHLEKCTCRCNVFLDHPVYICKQIQAAGCHQLTNTSLLSTSTPEFVKVLMWFRKG